MKRPLYSNDDYARNEHAHDHARGMSIEIGRSPFRQDTVNLIHSPYFRRLEGKTQLFPESEADLFRDRLTHSLEVAQIARDLTVRLNRFPFFQTEALQPGDMHIDLDLVEFAALAHDIGHPPFGHTGEKVLDEQMLRWGGFEGNAQTLRTICRLIKRQYPSDTSTPTQLISSVGLDKRIGQNITFRAVASVLKYDKLIPELRSPEAKLHKGYYSTEWELVERTKRAVLNGYQFAEGEQFRTLECWIMDVSDDIAYSTYDIEDAFTAGLLRAGDFLHPREEVLHAVYKERNIEKDQIRSHLRGFAEGVRKFVLEKIDGDNMPVASEINHQKEETVFDAADRLLLDGHIRTQFIAWWINFLIDSIEFAAHHECPALSRVELKQGVRQQVETLKSFVFHTVTLSAPLQTVNFKGERIVSTIYDAIQNYQDRLLPPYERQLMTHLLTASNEDQNVSQVSLRHRIFCDYIAGMTDEFAASLYDQLMSGQIARTVNHQLYY